MNKPYLYYYHDESDSFFLAEVGWENIHFCTKIGLTTKPGVNNLMRKIVKNIGTDSVIYERAMDILEFDEVTYTFRYYDELTENEKRKAKI